MPNTNSQTPGQQKSVLLSAIVQNNPSEITLNWQPITGSTSIKIYKKNKTSTSWGNPVSDNLPGSTTSWTDTGVQSGTGYEYRVLSSGTNTAIGYIYAGIELSEVFYKGKILLVCDTVSTHTLDFEINRWINDAAGDGYEVIKIAVNQNDTVPKVKEKILQAFHNDPLNVKSVFLLGRVPVPYSGVIAPDGHMPDHLGAWPADGYYAELTGDWSDVLAKNSGASSDRNRNIPGDGKFDQNTFPSDLELQIGRVDMRNLSSFPYGETELLKLYLDKNHAFRNKVIKIEDRALIDDEFTSYPEGFSASGWRNFSSLCGPENTQNKDYSTTLKENSYLWSYGCGGGNYKNCSGVIGTPAFIQDSIKTVFTMLFGSYFGDWDSPDDNLLRSALASGSTLTNCWSGRPYWYFHHMALGENIGYSALVSMNNSGTYDYNNNQRGVHMALMGDPTLKSHVLAPVQDFSVSEIDNFAYLQWTASTDSVIGYNIYRKNDTLQIFEKINVNPISDNFYTDSCLIYPGKYVYMVRPIKMEITNSGSFYNLGVGKLDTLINFSYNPIVADFSFETDGNNVKFANLSQNATSYLWDFGDGKSSNLINPVHEYLQDGNYNVKLNVFSQCGTDTISKQITILSGGLNTIENQITVYPIPATENLIILYNSKYKFEFYKIFDLQGKVVMSGLLDDNYTIQVSDLYPGLHFLLLEGEDQARIRFIKL